MSSVLHVSLEAPGIYSSKGLTNAFIQHFGEVSVFDWQRIKFDENVIGMWERLIAKTYMEEPDSIFLHIQSAGNLDHDVLRELNAKSFTILYSFDVRTDIGWIKDLAPHLGLVIVPDYDTADELKKDGFNNVEVLHSSADYDLYRPVPIQHTEGFSEIVFIGNNYVNTSLDFPLAQQRVEMVEFLQKEYGNRFGVFGNNWGGHSKIINTHDEINVYSAAKIAVTQNQFNRRGYSSDRIWRSMGCGCPTISQYYNGINLDFNPHVIKTWLNFDMLRTEIEKLLNSDKERRIMGEAGREHVLANHSWSNRVVKIKEFIQKHKK